MPPGELKTEQEEIRGQQQGGAEQGSWGEAPGQNGHKHVGRDFLFSACRFNLRNTSGWKQS